MTRVWHTTRVLTMLAAGGGLVAVLGTFAAAQQTGQPQTAQPAPAKAATAKAKTKPAAKAADGEEAAEKPAFDPEAALDKAGKALAEGKAPVALGLADQVLGHAGKTPRTTARALSIRGQARLRQGKPAEAISDLDNALWVKDGLGATDREAATTARAEAYRQAGIGGAPAIVGSAATQPQRTAAASAPAPARVPAPVVQVPVAVAPPVRPVAVATPAPTPSQPSSGIGGFFSNLFGGSGGSSTTTDTTAALPAAPKPPAISSSEPQRVTGAANEAGGARAAIAREAARPKTASVAAVAPANAAVVRAIPPTEGSQIQLAALRTREAAMELAAKVRKDNAAAIGGRTFEIDEPVFGNMGKFYRVRIGPFASPTESLGVCSALRNQGVDCMIVGQ